ncbi:MAG: SGNH/GDSL hydrolase family protein [Clostridia bacterium]|nr:SGNH/GDSL hydrolase family protein [Clostridia bacterium]
MELKNKVINFLGDSITFGSGTSGFDARFSHLMEKTYALKRANNYGIGGTRIARQQTPSESTVWDEDFCKRCTEMDLEADINVVFGGTNDFGHGDAPLGAFDNRTPDTFYGACHALMRSLIETYPEAVTVICTPLHRLNENDPRGDWKKVDVAPLSVYVGILKKVAAYYALPVLDLWQMSGLQPAVPIIKDRYMPDGLHPNDAGHKILCARIGGFLQSL